MQAIESNSEHQHRQTGTDASKSTGEQAQEFSNTFGTFVREHPYTAIAAGATMVAGVAGVVALTRGRALAAGADVVAQLPKGLSNESGLLREAVALLSSEKAPVVAFGKSALPEASPVLARPAVGFASLSAENQVARVAVNSIETGSISTKARRIGFAGLEDSPTVIGTGSMESLGAASETAGGYGKRQIALFVNTGEKTSIDLSKAGELKFVRVDKSRVLNLRPREFYKEEFVLDGGDPNKFDFSRYISQSPEVRGTKPFFDKLGKTFTREWGEFPFRVSSEVKSPVVMLDREADVVSLLIPPRTTKAQLSEAMAITANASRVLSNQAGRNASMIVEKQAFGFMEGTVKAKAESIQEMMMHSLKGSSAWLRGDKGNTFTQFLRDTHGDFTSADRKALHNLFTNERVRLLDIPSKLRQYK